MRHEAIPLTRHWELLRRADMRFLAERDRRYAEVNIEREKALKIKETADLAALQLAREIQTYKDEKANELREQISSERGHYASKEDLQSAIRELRAELAPLTTYATAMQGQARGASLTIGNMVSLITVMALLAGLVIAVLKLGH